MNPNIGDEASRGGQAKQEARIAAARALANSLPPLVTVENAKERLATVYTLMLDGSLSGSQGGAATRAVEVWLKSVALENDVHRIKQLEKRVAELEGELARAQKKEPWGR